MTESHLNTAVIDSKQGKNVITANIPNTFEQTNIKKKQNGEQTTMTIREQPVSMLMNVLPEEY